MQYGLKEYAKDQIAYIAQDAVNELLHMLWHEYAVPALRAKIHQIGVKAVTAIESTTHASVIKEAEIIDGNSLPLTSTTDYKVANFPQKRVG